MVLDSEVRPLRDSGHNLCLGMAKQETLDRFCFAPVSIERRRSRRLPYSGEARIACYDGHSFPDESAFWNVVCRDLSQGGVSFFSTRKPPRSTIVISLPGATQCVVAARIVHCSGVVLNPQRQYLVGCEFTDRLA